MVHQFPPHLPLTTPHAIREKGTHRQHMLLQEQARDLRTNPRILAYLILRMAGSWTLVGSNRYLSEVAYSSSSTNWPLYYYASGVRKTGCQNQCLREAQCIGYTYRHQHRYCSSYSASCHYCYIYLSGAARVPFGWYGLSGYASGLQPSQLKAGSTSQHHTTQHAHTQGRITLHRQ